MNILFVNREGDMRSKIIELIKNLDKEINILNEEQSEFNNGQIEMAKCVKSELQRIVLGLK